MSNAKIPMSNKYPNDKMSNPPRADNIKYRATADPFLVHNIKLEIVSLVIYWDFGFGNWDLIHK
jgi:hypothetical protein